MSDIGFHGLGALIIFFGLLILNSFFLILSIFFLLFENWKKKRIIRQFNAKGLFISTLIVSLTMLFLLVIIDNSSNIDFLDFMDLIAPFLTIAILIGLLIANFKYSRRFKNPY